MGLKKITAERLTDKQATLDRMNDYIGNSVFTVEHYSWTMDSSQELIISGAEAVQSTTDEIISAVDALDDYLDGVAKAFEEADLALADSIQSGTSLISEDYGNASSANNPYENSVR